MLESMRKHAQGWLAKVILGAIILSFALWGVGDYFTGNQVSTVAEIDGEAIYDVDFAEAYKRQLASYSNMLGEQFTKELAEQMGVKNETIQTMINRRLMLLEADTMGLVVPNQAVLGTVQSNPAFQEAKSFSSVRYQGLTRQMGFASPRDYENYLRQSIMIDTLQKGITDSSTVTEQEVMAHFKAKFEKRVLSALIINPETLKKGIKVTDQQAREWFEAHKSSYQSPLKVELQAVEIDAAKLIADVVVSDKDIEQAYVERQSEFGTPERRRISHILIPVDKTSAGEVLAMAEDKIKAAQKRLAAGESFASVAKDMSADSSTAAKGGDLGEFEQGAMLPEFEEVVFSKLKVGEVSDSLRTQFGLHLVQLNEVKREKMKALAEVRDDIRRQLVKQAAGQEAYRLSEDLDNALGMEDSLQAAAKVVSLKVLNLGKLSTENVLANPLLSTSKELQRIAFSMMPGAAVEIVEVSDGHFVALEVLQRINPETMAYDEVVNRVYNDVRADKAVTQAQAMADKILAAALAGDSIDKLAQTFAQPKYISKPVLSTGEGDDSVWIQDVLAPSFRVPEASWLDATLTTRQGIAVVFVKDVQEASDAKFEAEAKEVRGEALKSKGAVRFARWMASVRDRHDISINNKVLSRF